MQRDFRGELGRLTPCFIDVVLLGGCPLLISLLSLFSLSCLTKIAGSAYHNVSLAIVCLQREGCFSCQANVSSNPIVLHLTQHGDTWHVAAGIAHAVSVVLYCVRLGVLSRSRLQKYRLLGRARNVHALAAALAFLSFLIVLFQLNGRIAAKAFDFVSGKLAPFELTGWFLLPAHHCRVLDASVESLRHPCLQPLASCIFTAHSFDLKHLLVCSSGC